MTKVFRSFAFVALVLVAVPLVAPGTAFAQYREFSGRIDKINKKKLVIDNRMGDKVSFVRIDETAVEGEGKESWEDLKKGDWARVSWKFVDKPRKAYKVNVVPAPAEEGEDG